jgi:hypothetical protein
MAHSTLLDIAKANGADRIAGVIDETSKAHPEIELIPSRTIKGLNFKTIVRAALGRTTGSFRSANEGLANVKNTYETRLVETYILNPRFEVDRAVADRHEDGAEAFVAMETAGILEGEWQGLSSQVYYGTTSNAKGFPGLLAAYDATNMVVDAGGTTATTGSSVWLVRTGPQDVTWVWGQGGMMKFDGPRPETITDGSSNKYDGLVATLLAYPGLQVSARSICRIKKLTADSGKGLTDTLLAQAMALFPAGRGPNLCLMTQRSLQQLRTSRTATTTGGGPGAWPTMLAGIDGQEIRIAVTDAISNTESLSL